MKRKTIFISSLAVSLVLAAMVIIALFPNAENLWSNKTASVQITKTDAQQPVVDNQSATTNQMQDQQSLQDEAQPENTAAVNQVTANAPAAQSPATNTDSAQTANGKIVPYFVSWGYQKSSGRSIEAIIIHSSYDATGSDPFSVAGVIAEWKAAGVSPHYLIDRTGMIYQLVVDSNIAYHAGTSKLPDGKTDVNGVSIGIEMINTQTAQFTDAQYSSLNYLIALLKGKYPIKYILGHSQISPGRKTDPWNIDWSKVQK
jgi:hypothetical protein